MAQTVRSKSNGVARNRRGPTATRAAILDSAEQAFAKHGVHGARTETIAREAGITKAMINYYFHSKENLYVAVMERVYCERADGMDVGLLAKLPPIQALEQYIKCLLEQLSRKPHIAPLFALENVQNEGRYVGKGKHAGSILVDIIERGVTSGDFRSLDPRHAAINVMGICIHYFNVLQNVLMWWPTGQRDKDRIAREHAESALDFVYACMVSVPPGHGQRRFRSGGGETPDRSSFLAAHTTNR